MANRPSDIDATLLQLEILRRIPKLPRKIDAKSLHEQLLETGFERDLRTIQRTLKILCEHFDIECDERSKPFGYSWKLHSEGLVLPILNEQQSLLLKLAEQHLKYLLPANLMASMKPFFEQADKMVSGSKDKPEYQWLNKVCSTPTSLPLIPAKIKDEIFAAVSQALFQNKLLHIEYQNQFGKKHSATIMPLAIAQQGASIYLVCRYEGFEDNRLLALHRIRKAEISTFTFERPKDFNLQRYQNDGHLGFGNGDKICLTFSISKSAGFHLTETPIAKDQKMLEESEEHYRFQATVADNNMLEWWLRKFGEDIWDIEKEPV
ncbi:MULTISPECIES: YafY family protein [Mannheimia]|uniref:WYL domain-containing protein n=1 Tax=Mannheimia pernigra TaxID=111844 RepID=A0ABD7A8F4_9PAST|nr:MULTISPECIES: WYL domain-containing protein [Mannheimia]QLB42453.1 WYL domain-containing protein [Mannheimia pernigra]QTM00317.1 WYL domain-containing protein [Mannheimia sp. ZY171111]